MDNLLAAQRSCAEDQAVRLWMLRDPSGKDVSVFRTKSDAWFDSFLFQSWAYQTEFWKMPEKSQAELRRRGWTVVRGKFTQDAK